jgi:hypothetical protein
MMGQYDVIAAFVGEHFPDATTSTRLFSDGAFDMEVRYRDALVSIQHSRRGEYGISLVSENSLGFGGHDSVFTELCPVLEALKSMLSPSQPRSPG